MPLLRWLSRHVFNSVPFGITLLVLIGLYVAVGSGFVSLREWLEMDELLFFNWWPLKVLIVLLIANLLTVTIVRIPLTPPRYGVWCIHLGIILLVLQLSVYYSLKVEGMVPLVRGQTSGIFYDRWERSLFVRTPFSTGDGIPLPQLPRFNEYDEAFGNASVLDQPSLRNLEASVRSLDPQTRQPQQASLAEALGLSSPVQFDIIGYYPYGEVERWTIDPSVRNTALKLTAPTSPGSARWLVANQAAEAIITLGPAVVEHRHVPTTPDIELSTNAARRLHKLTIKVAGQSQETFVEPTESIEVSSTGYSLQVEGFTPQFTLSSQDEKADMLTVLITRRQPDGTEKTFRRTILSNRDVQTDFDLEASDAGPFGKRKTDGLLDEQIQLAYSFNDPTKVLPTMESVTVKYLLFTADDAPGITMLRVSSRDASVVSQGEKQVDLRVTAPAPMLNAGVREQALLTLNIERFDHVKPSDAVVSVPRSQRQRDIAQGGRAQIARVRVRCGDWSQVVPVPFEQFALHNVWSSPKINIPGASAAFQLMLGNRKRDLPVAVRLESFEAQPYAGGDVSESSMMRDFRSNITLDPNGKAIPASASMNEPAFYRAPAPVWFAPGESWLFSQASWNPEDLDFTVLQVGNRPAVRAMLLACIMIFGGLMYAFYVKPIIIRRMKLRALQTAATKKKPERVMPHETEAVQPV